MPLGTTNSDPTSDRKMSFFTPVFRPDLWEIMLSLHPLRLERQQKRFLKINFEFPYSSFFFYSEGNWNDKYLHTPALVVSSKIIPNSRPKWAKSIPVFRPKPGKNSTFCGCTYLQGLCKGVTPPPPAPTWTLRKSGNKTRNFLASYLCAWNAILVAFFTHNWICWTLLLVVKLHQNNNIKKNNFFSDSYICNDYYYIFFLSTK